MNYFPKIYEFQKYGYNVISVLYISIHLVALLNWEQYHTQGTPLFYLALRQKKKIDFLFQNILGSNSYTEHLPINI